MPDSAQKREKIQQPILIFFVENYKCTLAHETERHDLMESRFSYRLGFLKLIDFV